METSMAVFRSLKAEQESCKQLKEKSSNVGHLSYSYKSS